LAAGGWRLAAGGWRVAAGGWRARAQTPATTPQSRLDREVEGPVVAVERAARGAQRILFLGRLDRLRTWNDPCDVRVGPRIDRLTVVPSLPALLSTRLLFSLALLSLLFLVSLIE
jgi:hypothetical protein